MKFNIILVSIIHRKQNNEILLIKRKREPGKGMWSLPGGVGAFNKTKDPKIAIAKEVYSDFSVKYIDYNFFTMQYIDLPEPTICLYFEGCINKKPIISGLNTITEIKWFNIKELIGIELAFEKSDKKVMELYCQNFLS